MEKFYEKPEVEIIEFMAQDIICTSNTESGDGYIDELDLDED